MWTTFQNQPSQCLKVPLRRTRWEGAPSFLQVRPVWPSVAVATFQRAYHDSPQVSQTCNFIIVMPKHIPSPFLGLLGAQPRVRLFYSEAFIYLFPAIGFSFIFSDRVGAAGAGHMTPSFKMLLGPCDTAEGAQHLRVEVYFEVSWWPHALYRKVQVFHTGPEPWRLLVR